MGRRRRGGERNDRRETAPADIILRSICGSGQSRDQVDFEADGLGENASMICSLWVAFPIGKPADHRARPTVGPVQSSGPTSTHRIQPSTFLLSVNGTGGEHDWMPGQLLFLMDGLNVGVIRDRCHDRPACGHHSAS